MIKPEQARTRLIKLMPARKRVGAAPGAGRGAAALVAAPEL